MQISSWYFKKIHLRIQWTLYAHDVYEEYIKIQKMIVNFYLWSILKWSEWKGKKRLISWRRATSYCLFMFISSSTWCANNFYIFWTFFFVNWPFLLFLLSYFYFFCCCTMQNKPHPCLFHLPHDIQWDFIIRKCITIHATQ